MHFSFLVTQENLDRALGAVKGSVNTNALAGDISSHYLFRLVVEEGNQVLNILTYTGRLFSKGVLPHDPEKMHVEASLEEIGEGKVAFTIEAKRLDTWISSLGESDVRFTFEGAKEPVTISSVKGTQTFQSLDPEVYPYWDKLLLKAELQTTLDALRFASALDFSKGFVSDQETKTPTLCVCESYAPNPELEEDPKASLLYASDRRSMSMVKMDALHDAHIRVFFRDIPKLLGFLRTTKTFEDQTVELLKHERAMLYRRADGSVLGCSLYEATFPTLNVSLDADIQHTVGFSKQEMSSALSFLSAGSAWEDVELHFHLEDSSINLSMSSMTGKETTISIPCTLDPPPDAPLVFKLDRFKIQRVLQKSPEDEISMQIISTGKAHYTRFLHKIEEDTFAVILAWLN